MKKNDNTEKDAAFLRAHVKATEKRIGLPENLSEENITDLVSGKKQKTAKRVIFRRVTAAVLAACVAVVCTVVYDYSHYEPKNISVERDGLNYAKSYDEILKLVKDYSKKESIDLLMNGFYYGNRKDAAAPDMIVEEIEDSANFNDAVAPGVGAVDESAADSIEKTDHSDLNTRVDGVAEADRCITDGEYLYVNSYYESIGIFKAEEDGSVVLMSQIDHDMVKEDNENISFGEFFVVDNYLILNCAQTTYGEYFKTKYSAVVFDISDKTDPKVVRTFTQDGYCISSRIVDGSLIMISNYSLNNLYRVKNITEENVIPGTYNDGCKTSVPADKIAVVNTEKPDSYVIVTKCSLTDLSAKPQTTALFGGGCEVYCTNSTLYVTNTEYCFESFARNSAVVDKAFLPGEKTAVIAFDITGTTPTFKALATVNGYLLNNFSIDEHNGYLRMAVTRNNDNAVVVLDKDLKQIAELDGIGKGEIIKSVRFMGDTAYVVTFVQTDPLFVIDLKNPEKPEIKGEVKLPGFSSYLHPAGDGLMLGIGTDGTEDGINDNAKISLFDVSDPTAPKEIDNLILEHGYLETDYKAFVTCAKDNSFIIPFNAYTWYDEYDGEDYSVSAEASSGAVRIKVENGKIVLLNKYLDSEIDGNCERAAYIGNTVYTVSFEPIIVSYDMTTGEKLYSECFESAFSSEPDYDDVFYSDDDIAETEIYIEYAE